MRGGMTRGELAMIEYGDARRLLVLGGADHDLSRISVVARAEGYRICGTAALTDALARLDRQIGVDCIWAVLDGEDLALEEQLLARLDLAAADGRLGSVVGVGRGRLDWAFALAPHPLVQILEDPSGYEEQAALAAATPPAAVLLHDVNRQAAQPRLQQLSEEVGRIAAVLAALSEDEPLAGAPIASDSETLEAATIRAIIRARRLRERFFRQGLFADPAWDMLLDLMAARLEGQQVAVSSLCIAAAVPSTTALRWIKALTEAGLFVRRADREDRRRVYIELSDDAAARFTAYLRAAMRVAPLTV